MALTDYTIAILIKAIDEASGPIKKLRKTFEGLGKEVTTTAKALRPLGVALTAAGAAGSALIASSTLLAARSEELKIVLDTIGVSAGYTTEELLAYENSVKALHLTTVSTRQALVQMIQAEIDLEQATKLARLAQDSAVIANLDSSETLERLIHVIQVGIPRMARALGLNVNFAESYKELADELGKTTEELTRQERQQARVNEVLRAGTRITGTYEAAMETAGKRLRSLKTDATEAATIFGETFLPALGTVVDATADLLQAYIAMEPEAQKAIASLTGLGTAVSLASGTLILLAPRIVATAGALGTLGVLAKDTFTAVTLLKGGFAASEVASLGLAGTLGVTTVALLALAAAAVSVAAIAKFSAEVTEQQETAQGALNEVLEEGIAINETAIQVANLSLEQRRSLFAVLDEGIGTEKDAVDVANEYHAARHRINEVLEGTPAILRWIVAGQDELTLSHEELNDLLLRSATNYDNYLEAVQTLGLDAIPQEADALAQASAALSHGNEVRKEGLVVISSELDFLAQRNELVDGAVRADRRFVAEQIALGEATEDVIVSAEELNEALREQQRIAADVTDAAEAYEDYLDERTSLAERAGEDLAAAEQEYQEDLQSIVDVSAQALLDGEQDWRDRRQAIIDDTNELLTDAEEQYGEDRAAILADTITLLQDLEDAYQTDRALAQRDAMESLADAERDYNEARIDIIEDSADTLADLETDYRDARKDVQEDAAAEYLQAEQDYNEARAQISIDAEADLLAAQEDYLRSREQALADYERSLIRSEEDYQYNREDLVSDANQDVADIENEYANRQYELVESSAQEIAWFRAQAAAKEARLQSRILREENETQRAALLAQLEQLQISNAETLADMEGHYELVSGIEREEADKQIARVREREAERLEALEEAWETEKRRLARRQEDKMRVLEEKWAEEQENLANHQAERYESLDAAWVEEQEQLAEREQEKLDTLEDKWQDQQEALAERTEERLETLKDRYDKEIRNIEEKEADKLRALEEKWAQQQEAAAKKEARRLADLLKAYEQEKVDLAEAQEKKLEALNEAWDEERTALQEKEKKDLETLETSWTQQQKDLEKTANKRLKTLEKSWAEERKKLEEHYAKERIQFIDHKIALLETIDDRTEAQDEQLEHLREVREAIGREYGLWDDASLETARMTDLITAAVGRMDPVAWAALMHEWDMALDDGIISSDELGTAISNLDEVSRNAFLTQFPRYRGNMDLFGSSTASAGREMNRLTNRVGRLRTNLDHLPRRIDIEIVTTTTGPQQYQHGTAYHRGGRAIVGEQGPELLDLPVGTRVHPTYAPATQHALAGGGGSGGLTIQNYFGAGSVRSEEDIEMIATAIQESMSLRGVRAIM